MLSAVRALTLAKGHSDRLRRWDFSTPGLTSSCKLQRIEYVLAHCCPKHTSSTTVSSGCSADLKVEVWGASWIPLGRVAWLISVNYLQ